MTDYAIARKNMVDCQIHPQGVTNYAILAAFLSVPREHFIAPAKRSFAYMDEDISVSTETGERFLMEPVTLARLVQLADIQLDDVVLDVGCATGYSATIIAKLCSSVVALESDEGLAAKASETLLELGVDNAVVIHGPLEKGIAKEGPYDAIFIGGGIDEVPSALFDQLKDGGRLVVVEGQGNAGVARLYLRQGDIIGATDSFNAAVEPLPGFQKTAEFVF